MSLIRRAAGLCLLGVVGLIVAVPAASARQRVITWNLRSKYVTKHDALVGLTGDAAAAAGPTGLRSWVVLPNGYNRSRCWPVLYLLHAAGSANEWVWQTAAFANLPAIVVIPGGGDGQYTDWFNNGSRRPGWESWFSKELVPKVASSFPICPQRSAHAIAGSSMGGFGAMYLASQRPDYFGTAASFSGIIDLGDPVIQFGFAGYPTIWGPPGEYYALGHDPTYLLPTLGHTRLFVFVGNGTPLSPQPNQGQKGVVEAVMRHQARDFVAAAKRDHVPVRFEEHDGIHSQDNWNLDLALLIAQNPFATVPTNPKQWRYTTTSQSGTAWMYRYSFSVPPKTLEEFTYRTGTLRGVGSGKVKITQPNGKSLTATMPFMLRHGTVRSGHSGAPGGKPPKLPIPLTLRAISIRPRNLLHVSFKARRLSSKRRYQLTAFQGSRVDCSLSSIVRLPATKPGATVNLTLRPGTGSGHPKNRWCKGPGSVNLTIIEKNVSALQVGTLVGQTFFKVR